MEGGGGLVLVVALGAQRAEGAKVQGARNHEAAGRDCVGEHVALAVAERVGAVLRADARGGAPALGGDLVEDARHGAAGRRRGGLEVLLELGRGPVGGRRRGLAGQGGAVAQRCALGGAARARAVGLDLGAPLDVVVEVAADLGRGHAVDVRLEDVAVKGHGAVDAGAARGGGQERAADEEVKVATGAEVVHLGGVEIGLDTLTGGEGLEGILSHVGSLDLEADTIKGDLVGCTSWVSRSGRAGIVVKKENPLQSSRSRLILATV